MFDSENDFMTDLFQANNEISLVQPNKSHHKEIMKYFKKT